MEEATSDHVSGSVMVVGGGIAGMQSALDLANSEDAVRAGSCEFGLFCLPRRKCTFYRRCHAPIG